jgi:hypothetical protein
MADKNNDKELDRLLGSIGDSRDDQVIFRMEYESADGRYFRNAIVRDDTTIAQAVDIGVENEVSPDDKFICGSIIMPVGYRKA